MFDPASLVWTSREEVTSALLTALDTAHATCAMDLCRAVAPPSAAAALLAVARARDRPYWVRVYALRAHAAVDAALPDEVLESFFAEWFFSPGGTPLYDPAAPGVFELRDALAAVKTPSHERIAMRWLARSSPDVRARALVELATSYKPPAPQTAAWLADEWLTRDGRGCSAGNNRAVLLHVFPERPTAAPSPYAKARAALELRLPVGELLGGMGPRRLRNRVRRAVVARSAQLTREDFTPSADPVASRYRHALDAVRGWRDGPDVTTGLLRGVALHPAVRADLVRGLLASEPARAIELVAARLGAEDDRLALRAVLTALTDAEPWALGGPAGPRIPVDVAKGDAARALVSRALRTPGDEAARYLAIGASESLEGPRPATLRALADVAEPLVRVRALTSLANLGDRDAEARLARAAVDERRVEVRAVAVRALGALPSAREHLGLFDRVLATDHATFGDDAIDLPAVEQAALAVVRAGGDGAMTTLLRRAFGVVTNDALSVMKAGLRVGADESLRPAPLTCEERAERIGDPDVCWASRWSPLAARRYGRFGE